MRQTNTYAFFAGEKGLRVATPKFFSILSTHYGLRTWAMILFHYKKPEK